MHSFSKFRYFLESKRSGIANLVIVVGRLQEDHSMFRMLSDNNITPLFILGLAANKQEIIVATNKCEK